jgi:hypothetical protein
VNGDRRIQYPRGKVVARLFTAVLVVGFGFTQLWASWHAAGVRHVRCTEHGELIDSVADSSHGPVLDRGTTTQTTVAGAETTTPVAHEHCAVAFALRGSAQVQVVTVAVRLVPPAVVVRSAVDPAPRPGRTLVLANAPKTSPPSA